jgi:L-asparaginase II
MLLACRRAGLDPGSYPAPDHPLQGKVLDAVRDVAGEPAAIGVDGCGAPVHAVRLAELARLFAGLVAGRLEGAERACAAMRAEPYLVAGRGRVCTALMRRVPGVVVKVGAEGLICAGLLDRGLGVAIKVEDGGTRAVDPAIVRALRLLDAIDDAGEEALRDHGSPTVLGGGSPVGALEATFDLAS